MWETVRWLHLLAVALFVGGQLALVAVIVPVMRGRDELRAMARRFGGASLVALAVLAVTGAALAIRYDDFSRTALQVKLGLVVLVAGLVLLHARRPRLRWLEALIFLVSLVIVWLGVDLAH